MLMFKAGTRRLMDTYASKTGRAGGVLFTAGPINTSVGVRNAQTVDYGSRSKAFVGAISRIRSKLLEVASVDGSTWSAVPMQGSGTMGIESVISSFTPKEEGKVSLVIRNGAYSFRMADVISKLGLGLITFDVEEGKEIDLAALEAFMAKHKDTITNVGVVHCETSTGMFNPVAEIGQMARRVVPSATVFIDAMSSFGAVPLDVEANCDVMVTSANKCFQSVPGFSIILARKSLIAASRGRSPSFTLDVVKQAEGLDKAGQFNFTPPVQALMAFDTAMLEHEQEGGIVARGDRYKSIANYVADQMEGLGFKLFLDRTKPSFGYIITAYHSPTHPKWNFEQFYSMLNERGFVIYPGKASKADTFRIGSLGDITLKDAEALMVEIKAALVVMGVSLK